MVQLCCEYLSVRCIWLYVIVMSCTRFRVNNYRVWIHSETPTWHDNNIQSNEYRDKYSQHSSIIWPIWLHDWVFVYELSGCLIVLRTFCCWFFISSTTSSKTTLLITKLEWENTFYFKEDAHSKYKTKSLNLGWPETNNKKQSSWRILGGLIKLPLKKHNTL